MTLEEILEFFNERGWYTSVESTGTKQWKAMGILSAEITGEFPVIVEGEGETPLAAAKSAFFSRFRSMIS